MTSEPKLTKDLTKARNNLDEFGYCLIAEALTTKELETALAGYRADDDEVQLGWLYVTDPHAADLSSMHTYLRQKSGVDHWVGSDILDRCRRTHFAKHNFIVAKRQESRFR